MDGQGQVYVLVEGREGALANDHLGRLRLQLQRGGLIGAKVWKVGESEPNKTSFERVKKLLTNTAKL